MSKWKPGDDFVIKFSDESNILWLCAKNVGRSPKKQLKYCRCALSAFATRTTNLWPGSRQFTREAAKNLNFLLHPHQVRMVFNVGSAETNAGFRSVEEATVVCGEMKTGI